ncbi:hypothetical protein BX600DRAFT_530105 [Xylariales sp. PMI_506]|nr:hypothetical protein BX600DRAFT_530105 [Xylariales sp. PMI_506]
MSGRWSDKSSPTVPSPAGAAATIAMGTERQQRKKSRNSGGSVVYAPLPLRLPDPSEYAAIAAGNPYRTTADMRVAGLTDNNKNEKKSKNSKNRGNSDGDGVRSAATPTQKPAESRHARIWRSRVAQSTLDLADCGSASSNRTNALVCPESEGDHEDPQLPWYLEEELQRRLGISKKVNTFYEW